MYVYVAVHFNFNHRKCMLRWSMNSIQMNIFKSFQIHLKISQHIQCICVYYLVEHSLIHLKKITLNSNTKSFLNLCTTFGLAKHATANILYV